MNFMRYIHLKFTNKVSRKFRLGSKSKFCKNVWTREVIF